MAISSAPSAMLLVHSLVWARVVVLLSARFLLCWILLISGSCGHLKEMDSDGAAGVVGFFAFGWIMLLRLCLWESALIWGLMILVLLMGDQCSHLEGIDSDGAGGIFIVALE